MGKAERDAVRKEALTNEKKEKKSKVPVTSPAQRAAALRYHQRSKQFGSLIERLRAIVKDDKTAERPWQVAALVYECLLDPSRPVPALQAASAVPAGLLPDWPLSTALHAAWKASPPVDEDGEDERTCIGSELCHELMA